MTPSPEAIGALVVALMGGASVIGGVIGAGIARRWLEPLIAEGIARYEALATTDAARRKTVREVIDDQTSRDDGVIRRHTRDHETRLAAAIESMRETNALVLEELAVMRGVMSAFLEHMPERRSAPSERAVTPPTSPGLSPTPPRRRDTPTPGR